MCLQTNVKCIKMKTQISQTRFHGRTQIVVQASALQSLAVLILHSCNDLLNIFCFRCQKPWYFHYQNLWSFYECSWPGWSTAFGYQSCSCPTFYWWKKLEFELLPLMCSIWLWALINDLACNLLPYCCDNLEPCWNLLNVKFFIMYSWYLWPVNIWFLVC